MQGRTLKIIVHILKKYGKPCPIGELYKDIDNKKSKEDFQNALLLAKSKTDKQTTEKKIAQLSKNAKGNFKVLRLLNTDY